MSVANCVLIEVMLALTSRACSPGPGLEASPSVEEGWGQKLRIRKHEGDLQTLMEQDC